VFTLVDATRLRVFREVAVNGSFTAAATALRISRPAVSQHIAKLEQKMLSGDRSGRDPRRPAAALPYMPRYMGLDWALCAGGRIRVRGQD
jgi:hypothetical protein